MGGKEEVPWAQSHVQRAARPACEEDLGSPGSQGFEEKWGKGACGRDMGGCGLEVTLWRRVS